MENQAQLQQPVLSCEHIKESSSTDRRADKRDKKEGAALCCDCRLREGQQCDDQAPPVPALQGSQPLLRSAPHTEETNQV